MDWGPDWGAMHAIGTASAGLIAVLAAIGYWIWSKRHWPRLAAFLVIGGMTAVVSGPVGAWLGNIAFTVDGLATSWIAQAIGAVGLSGLTTIFLIFPLWNNLWHGHVTTRTLILGAISPIAVAIIPGYIGLTLTTVLAWLAWLITMPISFGLGLL